MRVCSRAVGLVGQVDVELSDCSDRCAFGAMTSTVGRCVKSKQADVEFHLIHVSLILRRHEHPRGAAAVVVADQ